MEAKTVVVAGGTGFIGRHLIRHLLGAGHTVVVLTRRPSAARLPAGAVPVGWDPKGESAGGAPWQDVVAGADAVVNLAGESIAARRWSPRQKRRILESRVEATRALVVAMGRPRRGAAPVLVNASAVGYYGVRPPGPVGEEAPPGDDFLARVCVAWEAEARRAEEAGARVVLLRLGVVLGPGGGALARMAWPFRLGLGGVPGDGDQPFPWIHVADVAGLVTWALANRQASGPYNAVAPEAHTMASFCRALARALGRPCWLRVPAPVLRLALGEMADLFLGGQQAEPRRALAEGFAFRYPTLEAALAAALGRAG